MPLFYQHNINLTTKLAIWKIEEEEIFFRNQVPLNLHITHHHKRLQHLAGRYLLQFLFPNFPYNEIEISDTKKPFIPNQSFQFSISHCENFAAALVSKTNRVGIDIEQPNIKLFNIAPKFLSDDEILIHKIDLKNKTAYQEQLLTVLWSCKEAIFKWWGNGKVQFNEMIKLDEFNLQKQGTINAYFNNEPLLIHYKLINNLCLSWVETDLKKE